MPIRYIGRESHFHGKSLFEIARNLKNCGVGRYVYRVSFDKRYEEPSFYKLTAVMPEMNAKSYCRGKAVGEKVFRGRNYGPSNIDSGSKLDWRLIPKDQEYKWLNRLKKTEVQPPKKVPSTLEFPPLMKKLLTDELVAYGLPANKEALTLEAKIRKNCRFSNYELDTDTDSESAKQS